MSGDTEYEPRITLLCTNIADMIAKKLEGKGETVHDKYQTNFRQSHAYTQSRQIMYQHDQMHVYVWKMGKHLNNVQNCKKFKYSVI